MQIHIFENTIKIMELPLKNCLTYQTFEYFTHFSILYAVCATFFHFLNFYKHMEIQNLIISADNFVSSAIFS